MGNCHVPFLGGGKEVILVHVALAKSVLASLHEGSSGGRPPDQTMKNLNV